ncbi:hypothetical protein [Nonomuraea ceibae]|uniref:hypothetical protein n=1 Tax=Nonomuraea ceibae TaxID=1935170 RepID=UPI001C5D858F|nr:hypothetical protein [Nonomuraea ceibae]
MDLLIGPAGSRAQVWRVPDGWPLLSFAASTGRLVVVRVDHLSPVAARWFAATLAQAADAFAREVDACAENARSEPGWARRARTADRSRLVPVELGDPAGVVAVVPLAHRPPGPEGARS